MSGEFGQKSLMIITAGRTDWAEQHRIQGNMDLPLNASGVTTATGWIRELSPIGLTLLYAPKTGPAAETARILARGLKAKIKDVAGLSEVNLGLWQGLTLEEFRQKHPSVSRQWAENPNCVSAPGGEVLGEARERIDEAIDELIRKTRSGCIVVVLGRIASAMARLRYEQREMSAIWEFWQEPASWYRYALGDSGKKVATAKK